MNRCIEYRFVAAVEFRADLIGPFAELGRQGWVWRGNDWGFSVFSRDTTATAHPEASEPSRQQGPINEELLAALKASRELLQSCASDVAGTPTEEFFKSKVKHCDIVIAKAEGRNV